MSQDLSQRTGCLGLLLRLFGQRETPQQAPDLPYRVRDDFLSPAERSFYGVLAGALGTSYVVCPKVNVADLLFVVDLRSNFAYKNRIDRKHVDFVICEPARMRPVAVVELDDSTHQRKDRQERDEFLHQAFKAAGLPILRFAARQTYAPADLAAQVTSALTGDDSDTKTAAAKTAGRCPRCGGALLGRSSRKSPGGAAFLGCENYPRCRYTAQLGAP